MPLKRRSAKSRPHRVTPEAITAFVAGDAMRLHRLLGLRPWQPSPLAVDAGRAPAPDGTAWAASWSLAVELQRELQAAAMQR